MLALANNPQGSGWLERLTEPMRQLATDQSSSLVSRRSSPAPSIGTKSGVATYASNR